MENKFKGAVFDIDGTLLDSMGVWYEIDVDFFKERGLPMPEDYSKMVAQMGSWQTAVYTSELLGGRESPEELIEIWNDMVKKHYEESIPLKPHAKEYLEYLKSKGVKLGIATALFDEMYRPALVRTGVYDLFDVFVSSGEMKLAKSSPEVYLAAAEKMGVKPEECMVFEDIITGIRGAKKGGFYTVGVYDKSDVQDHELIEAESDRFIKDFKEMF